MLTSEANSCRGETLIEFKRCAIKAISVNTLKVISGETNELISDIHYSVVTKGANTYSTFIIIS